MEFNFNINNPAGKLNTPWNFGVNTCHAILWTREDMPAHAHRAAKECGFRYVRFHNMISKHTNLYTEDESGNPHIDFDKFDKIFDKVIAAGYLPFFEVGFCPDALSNHVRTLCYYEADTSVPNSFEKWDYLIKTMTEHVVERYGINNARKWYFEVWNEPDLFYDGTMEDYFELYDHTAAAIKSVDSQLRVGGPATSKCLWINEFIEHIEKGSEVTGGKRGYCDFISTHAYPSDLAYLEGDYGDVNLLESNIMYCLYKKVKEDVDKSSLAGLPIIMGEWNSSAGPFAINHDEKNNAAYIVKICDDLKDIIDGSMYWNLSDIYEEQDFHYIPFHGGYGLFNINDLPKSSYHAFELLNRMKGNQIKCEKSGGGSVKAISAFDNENNCFRVLCYYYREPGKANYDGEDVDIILSGIESETISFESDAVCDESGSAYEWWVKIGSPQFVNADILAKLKEKSAMLHKNGVLFKDDGVYRFSLDMQPGDIVLLQFRL